MPLERSFETALKVVPLLDLEFPFFFFSQSVVICAYCYYKSELCMLRPH